MSKEREEKTKHCVACMVSGKNLNYQKPKTKRIREITNINETWTRIQIDISGNLNHKNRTENTKL